jgi:hypothetical protein
MKCPICDKEMRKVRWEITNNFKMADSFVEYDKFTYQCVADDVWLTTEIPMSLQTSKNKR